MADIVLVTGGFGSLGRAVTAALMAKGFAVAAIDRAPAAQAGFAADIMLPNVDLADPKAVAGVISRVVGMGRALAGLVNAAGGFAADSFADDATKRQFASMHALNVETAVTITAAVLPFMQAARRGSVVNIGAASARQAAPGMAAYAAAKAALHSITLSLAAEMRPHGVRINAVLPTVLDTPGNRQAMPDADPAGWVRLEDAARAIAFLISDESRAITGAHIVLQ